LCQFGASKRFWFGARWRWLIAGASLTFFRLVCHFLMAGSIGWIVKVNFE
jgi:hypothetical protein